MSHEEETQEEWEFIDNPEALFSSMRNEWYGKGTEYWNTVDDTISGMLDGNVEAGRVDLQYTEEIIKKYQQRKMGNIRCADTGAGIGRISNEVLCRYFKELHLVEPVEKFLKVAKENLDNKVDLHLYYMGAESWEIPCVFDCFWLQWTLMYLTDEDSIRLLKNCKQHLAENGIIAVKENLGSNEFDDTTMNSVYYKQDNSIHRTYLHFSNLFVKAGLNIIEESLQPNWDEELLPLYLWILN